MKPRILVPFDFSDDARRALAWAADLHRALHPSEPIHLVHAISTMPVGAPDSVIGMLVPDTEEVAGLEREMEGLAAPFRVPVAARVLIQPRPVGELVLAAANDMQADLIVMGTHGRTGVTRLLMGSVAEHVVRHARCPVVTIRSGTSRAPG